MSAVMRGVFSAKKLLAEHCDQKIGVLVVVLEPSLLNLRAVPAECFTNDLVLPRQVGGDRDVQPHGGRGEDVVK